jgi:hypothetical protein
LTARSPMSIPSPCATQRPYHPALARASGPRAAYGRSIAARETRSTLGKNYYSSCDGLFVWAARPREKCKSQRKRARRQRLDSFWGAPSLTLQALFRECTRTLPAVLLFRKPGCFDFCPFLMDRTRRRRRIKLILCGG